MQDGPNDAIVYVVVAGSRGVRFLVKRQKGAPSNNWLATSREERAAQAQLI